MVDENELAGKLSPQQVFEHINVGCDLIEKALKAVDRDSTSEEFHQAIGFKVCLRGDRASGQKPQSSIPVTGRGGDNKTKNCCFLYILAQLSPLRDTGQFWTTGL